MINLNYFNQEKNLKCNEIEEYYIKNYIEKYDNDSYLKNCNKDEFDFYTLYYLSSISQNIINWYDFEENSKVLQIELDLGNITEALLKKNVDLTVVTNSKEKAEAIHTRCSSIKDFEIICARLEDIKFTQKFDYIVLIGCLPYKSDIYGKEISVGNFLLKLKELLNDKGRLLMAVDNKLAVRNLCGGDDFYTKKKYDALNGYPNSQENTYSFSRKKIESILKNIGINNINCYYPLPDFKLPNVIFSDKWIPNYTNFSKYEPYTIADEKMLVREIGLFKDILKENKELFKIFTNSFLVEAGNEQLDIKYKYISYNNMRKADYRLITKISDEYVQKDITNVYSEKHYDNIKNNIDLLKEENYNILDSVENGYIQSKYINSDYMLTNILSDLIENEKYDEFYELIDSFFKIFFDKSFKITDEETVFDKYNIPIEGKEKLHYLKNGFWDATFSNCFYLEDKFYLFDQEWNEKNLPVEYIIYKSIYYDSYISKNIKLDNVAKKYNFLEFLDAFRALDSVLQADIRDDKIWKFYVNINWGDFEDYTRELNNENIRLRSEVEHLKNKLNEATKDIERLRSNVIYKLENNIKKVFRRKE